MIELEEIKLLINDNRTEEAIEKLTQLAETMPDCDEIFYLRGNAYRKHNDWKHAMSDYCRATELNPESPAADAYKAACEILAFYNKDLYNP